ncbi:radical SAM protein [Nitrospirillum amazonense]|uniref:radical SAM protein n=1 Tax=Nitrospirillum amazonense TaxID=28077 RepID=UPI00241235BC|nr:radical SAM protein [Nitrospirillum amazonense]MDG3438998.1 radical SAM protein [Nitrospirillum amazonense]
MFKPLHDQSDQIHPIWLWLDPTSRCNLSCRLCYTKQSHGKLDLEPDDLEQVLIKLATSPTMEVKGIHLNWRGEPLMNPRFAELLAMTRRLLPHSPLQWHTNGTLLTPKRVREILAVPYSHTIYVSIDGGNQASHDLNRGEGSFQKTIKGLRALLDARGRDHGHVRVGVYQIDLNEPLEEYDPEFLELVARVDNHVKVTPLLPGGAHHKLRELDDLESDEALHRRMSQDINPSLPVPTGACFWAGHTLCMAPDGETSICVISHGAQGVVGNLMTETAETVVGRAVDFRRRMAEDGRQSILLCAGCRKPEGEIHAKHTAALRRADGREPARQYA